MEIFVLIMDYSREHACLTEIPELRYYHPNCVSADCAMCVQGVCAGYVLYRALVTPRTCARGKVIGRIVVVVGVVVVVSTKIAISRDVGI